MREYNWFAVGLLASVLAVLSGCGGGGGTDLTLTPQSIKTFRFEWKDSHGETEYRLLENPDGVSGYAEVATLPADSTEHELTVSLPGRINASYALLACNNMGCRDSGSVFVDTNLAGAVGYFKASNTDAEDSFGSSGPMSSSSVAMSSDGKTLVVGAPREASSATGVDGDETDNTADFSGAVYVFVQNEGVWSMQAYIKASNTGEGDNFGESVSLSDDGDTLAVGAYQEDSSTTGVDQDETDNSDNSANYAGAVYVFIRDASKWSQQAYIKASNTDAFDYFGRSVSLSADGDALAVGAINEDGTAPFSGAVYVFARDTETWSEQAYIKASNAGAGDSFGYPVSLSADGDTLAVGAYREDSIATGINGDESDDSAARAGAAYVFTRDANNNWLQQAYIKASNTDAEDRFGSAVALSADGNQLVVGAEGEASNAAGIGGDDADNSLAESGAVYVFRRDAGIWSQKAYVKAPMPGENDKFGTTVALSGDGDSLVVGATGEDSKSKGINGDPGNDDAIDSGAVYLY